MITDPDTLRIAVLCSRRAPGIAHLLAGERAGGYIVAGLLCSEPDFLERPLVEDWGVPWISHPLRAFHARVRAPIADRDARSAYDRGTVQALERFRPDLVFLMGWTWVLTRPLLVRYPDRILNAHHGDLAAADPRRRYPGLRAVHDAIAAGERETRACLHQVDHEVDHGPVILRSWAVPVAEDRDPRTHEALVLDRTFGPLFYTAARLASRGRLRLDGLRPSIDGTPTPFEIDAGGAIHDPGSLEATGTAPFAGSFR